MACDALVVVHALVFISPLAQLGRLWSCPHVAQLVCNVRIVRTSLVADGQQSQGMHVMLQVLDTYGGLDAVSDSKTAA